MKKKKKNLFNEYSENPVQKKRKGLKNKKRRRRIGFILFIMLIVFVIYFFMSDMSKVKSITVKGCHKLDESYIIENLSIEVNSTYYFNVDTDKLEEDIEKLIFVDNATVTNSFTGDITIDIEEGNAVTYCYLNNMLNVVDKSGVIVQDMEQKWLSYVQRTPQSVNFTEDQFKTFVEEYIKLPSDVQNQISVITFEGDEKDPTKCRLDMDDGKVFYVRIEDMATQLTSSNYYMVIQRYPDYKYYDFLGKNVYVYN